MNDLAISALATALSSATAAVATWSMIGSNAEPGAQPNSVAGLRTKATKSSAEAWVAGHRAALRPAKVTVLVSLTAVALSLLCLVASSAVAGMALPAAVLGGAALAAVMVGSSWACLVADRAARGVHDDHQRVAS